MAFIYSELQRIKGNIQNETDRLNALLNKFVAIVDENVNNQAVWYGASSNQFKTACDEFNSDEAQKTKKGFSDSIDDVSATITNWGRSEE